MSMPVTQQARPDETTVSCPEARPPEAPLAMPRQIIEPNISWLSTIYARFLHRA